MGDVSIAMTQTNTHCSQLMYNANPMLLHTPPINHNPNPSYGHIGTDSNGNGNGDMSIDSSNSTPSTTPSTKTKPTVGLQMPVILNPIHHITVCLCLQHHHQQETPQILIIRLIIHLITTPLLI